jgi:hypothetical protein
MNSYLMQAHGAVDGWPILVAVAACLLAFGVFAMAMGFEIVVA